MSKTCSVSVVLSHHRLPLFFGAELSKKSRHNPPTTPPETAGNSKTTHNGSEVLGAVLMSSGVEEQTVEEVCASCGKAAVDDIKLKKCACNLVRYCNLDCQKNHRPHHKKACKKKLAEIRDDKLFTQPEESHLGECSICCLPLPHDKNKWRMNSCCCKRICGGCSYANQKREWEQGLEHKCPFCREIIPNGNEDHEEEAYKNYMERVKANDPAAMNEMGKKCYIKGDYEGAIQYFTKAAALDDIGAHQNLSCLYRDGEGVEKDKKKEIYHLEEAAIGGHPMARYNLGYYDNQNGRYERAVKHWVIAANLGLDEALEAVKQFFLNGFVSKEDYEVALRGHQAALDATKSQQREAAEKSGRRGFTI